jgi:hypothetical protein
MTAESPSATLACERLTRSRESLRMALHASKASAAPGSTSLRWLDGLKVLPGFDAVLAALRAWWAQQPLRNASLGLSESAKTALLPLAQRAPFTLVLCAMALGGAFVWLRPWRWLTAPAVLAGLMPQVLGKFVANVPMQSWLAGLASLATAPSPPQAPPSGNGPSQGAHQ